MSLIATDMRNTRESARRIRFEPTSTLTATEVQSAIEQVSALAQAPSGNAPTIVTFAMSPYTPVITETFLAVDTSGGAVVIVLPLAATRFSGGVGYPITVKDDTGNADTNAISNNRSGAELLDGATTQPIDSKYGALTFQPKAAGGYDVF